MYVILCFSPLKLRTRDSLRLPQWGTSSVTTLSYVRRWRLMVTLWRHFCDVIPSNVFPKSHVSCILASTTHAILMNMFLVLIFLGQGIYSNYSQVRDLYEWRWTIHTCLTLMEWIPWPKKHLKQRWIRCNPGSEWDHGQALCDLDRWPGFLSPDDVLLL